MTGGERCRRRHAHPPLLGYPDAIPVGADACTGHLHGLVHHQGRRADGREPGERGTPALTFRRTARGRRRRGTTAWRSWRSRTPASAARPATAYAAAPPIGRRHGRNCQGGAAGHRPPAGVLRRSQGAEPVRQPSLDRLGAAEPVILPDRRPSPLHEATVSVTI